jgi:hypothetical protein
MTGARTWLRDNGLGVFFGVIFLAALAGQSIVGWLSYVDELEAEGVAGIGWAAYVTSSSFAVDVAENWQSEYLQFTLYIWATVWFVQRGSPESTTPPQRGPEDDAHQLAGEHARDDSPRGATMGGLGQALFSRSLVLVMGAIFLVSWLAQSVAGASAFAEQQILGLEDPPTWSEYVVSADFWSRTLQNWQSEFLAVGSMAVLAIYLRQRGSPESKRVGAPHAETGDP